MENFDFLILSLNFYGCHSFMCFQLEPFTDSWSDLVYGPIFYDVAKIEGDPVRCDDI